MPKTWCCCYWSWEETLKIHCEGAVLEFPNAEAREDYIDKYCACVPGWESCTIAANLLKNY